jgi:hypothetical protein
MSIRDDLAQNAVLAQAKKTQIETCGWEGDMPQLQFFSVKNLTGLNPTVHVADKLIQLKEPCDTVILTSIKNSAYQVYLSFMPIGLLTIAAPVLTGLENWFVFPGTGVTQPAFSIPTLPYLRFRRKFSTFYINIQNGIGGSPYNAEFCATNDFVEAHGGSQ